MKKMLTNIVVLLFFFVSIIIGCASTKSQKDQNVVTDETKKVDVSSGSYKDIEDRLIKLNSLLKEGFITEDEYYKIRAKILEEF